MLVKETLVVFFSNESTEIGEGLSHLITSAGPALPELLFPYEEEEDRVVEYVTLVCFQVLACRGG